MTAGSRAWLVAMLAVVPLLAGWWWVGVASRRTVVRHRLRADVASSGHAVAGDERRRRWSLRLRRAADDVQGRATAGVLDEIAGVVRSGASLRDGLEQAARGVHGAWLSSLANDIGHGRAVDDACRRWAQRSTDPCTRLAASALALAAAGGGEQARAIDAAADAVRERVALAGEVRAQAAQARLSALVLLLAPIGFTAWTVATDGRVRAFVVGTPLGWACLAAGASLDAVGALWMRALCRSVGR